MKNIIGEIHDTRELTQVQLHKAKETIKNILQLDTIESIKKNKEFYTVITDDNNIIDFKIAEYLDDKITLVKYRTYNDEMQRDPYGATLTYNEIKIKSE